MNRITLSGNLTRDPEVRYTQSGKAYARVAIAVNRRGNDKAVDFINLVAWDKTAEVMGKWLAKGSRILVDGRLQTSKYTGKDGNERTSTEVISRHLNLPVTTRKNPPRQTLTTRSPANLSTTRTLRFDPLPPCKSLS